MARVIFWGLVIVTTLAAEFTHAHPSQDTTARISLRDQAVEVHIKVKVLDWLAVLSEQEKGKSPGFTDEAIPDLLKAARTELLGKTSLLVGKKRPRIKVTHFPSTRDIQALLRYFTWTTERAAHLPRDFGWIDLTLASQERVDRGEKISLKLPRSLGPAHVTLVQPVQVHIAAGGEAKFSMQVTGGR